MKTSEFRNWVRNLWLENCEEHLTFSETPYTMTEYWNRYKYWIKREYRYQRRQDEHASRRPVA